MEKCVFGPKPPKSTNIGRLSTVLDQFFCRIQVKMGSSHQDIFFRQTQTFNEPQGWTFIDLRDKNGKPNRVFWLQVQVIQNHQNGRDTHIR